MPLWKPSHFPKIGFASALTTFFRRIDFNPGMKRDNEMARIASQTKRSKAYVAAELAKANEEIDRLREESLNAWVIRRKNMARGRLTPDVVEEIERLGRNGMCVNHVRQFYGIMEADWDILWKDKPNTISDILAAGKLRNVDFAANKLMEHVHEGNLKAIIFYLKTVGEWREMDKLAESDKMRPQFPAITLTINDPVEAAKIYQQVMTES